MERLGVIVVETEDEGALVSEIDDVALQDGDVELVGVRDIVVDLDSIIREFVRVTEGDREAKVDTVEVGDVEGVTNGKKMVSLD
mmetsp:Transcript_15435/g.19646  ORF Transcript_15435/g.19646 Transcript_15435/m.19646 type:complete len:84 (-) Transcript_15435:32-283(-)